MSVTVRWYDDQQTIVLYELIGEWTWDELYPQYDAAIAMEKSKPHRVDVIMDMRESVRLPANVLSHLKNITDKQPDNIGLTVVVTGNAFVRAMYSTGCKFYPKIQNYFAVAATMEEGVAAIKALAQRKRQRP